MPLNTCRLLAVLFLLFPLQVTGQENLLGDVDFPNSGAPEAQADFMEGVLLLHNFEYDDAARAFIRAQEKDSSFGMAYWGEAMTHNHPLWEEQNTETARTILNRLGSTQAERAANFPTEREKDYLEAVEILYGLTPETADLSKEERDDSYAAAMRSLHERYPGDDEARAFYALSILGTAHEGRDFATYMQAAAVAMDIWQRNKDHPGAAHYLIHSFDDPVHAPLGLPMAKAYSEIAPGAAHAQHMTSHIFVALGMWPETVRANQIASRVQDERREELGRDPNVCGHYSSWLQYGYLELGRVEKARKMMDTCAERVAGDPTTGELGYFASMRARMVLDRKEWDDASKWTASYDAGDWGAREYEFISGLSAAYRGEPDEAREHVETMWLKSVDNDDFAAIYEDQIEAILALHAGDSAQALSLLRKASEAEAELPFDFGPPRPVKPSYELLGEVLLEVGQYEAAQSAFETQLDRTPNRALSLMGLAAAASETGQSELEAQARKRLNGRIAGISADVE